MHRQTVLSVHLKVCLSVLFKEINNNKKKKN